MPTAATIIAVSVYTSIFFSFIQYLSITIKSKTTRCWTLYLIPLVYGIPMLTLYETNMLRTLLPGWLVVVIVSLIAHSNSQKAPVKRKTITSFYITFRVIETCCLILNFVGCLIFLSGSYASLIIGPVKFVSYSFAILFHGVYFALFNHCICAKFFMSIAKLRGLGVGEDIPVSVPSPGECTLCGHPPEDTKNVTLDCGHVYHENCVKGWMMTSYSAKCQACRAEISNKHADESANDAAPVAGTDADTNGSTQSSTSIGTCCRDFLDTCIESQRRFVEDTLKGDYTLMVLWSFILLFAITNKLIPN